MNIVPESYPTLPTRWRVLVAVLGTPLALCFWINPGQQKLLSLVIGFVIAFCVIALLLSKVRVRHDGLTMTWSPTTTTLPWKDVRAVDFGLSIATPMVSTACFSKINGRKVVFPVHGMSIHNKKAIADAFTGDKETSNPTSDVIVANRAETSR